mmetsp:Transcript_21365/g.52455  ORF Transcript_21365/g.52455 Transcript_21365/m.52455 type:complete len:222 (-) Transcript_21365:343-1008(-)
MRAQCCSRALHKRRGHKAADGSSMGARERRVVRGRCDGRRFEAPIPPNGDTHLDAALPVALNVAQVLGHSNHRRVHGHEASKEGNRRAPQPAEPQRLARGVVDAEIEEEAAACSYGDASREWEALELERWDRIEPADGRAEQVEAEDERIEACLDNCNPSDARADHESPGGARRDAAGSDRQEGLVHQIDVDIVDLVDADDEQVTQQQRQHAHPSARQHRR